MYWPSQDDPDGLQRVLWHTEPRSSSPDFDLILSGMHSWGTGIRNAKRAGDGGGGVQSWRWTKKGHLLWLLRFYLSSNIPFQNA